LALLSTIRWKNIVFTALAQYLSFLFAFNTKENLLTSLGEYKVHLIILSTGFILAGGYIINNFYDIEKDLINRPYRTRFQNIVSDGFKLKFYLALNLVGLVIALVASWRIFVFFFFYSAILWFYSHKLSKLVLVRELTASFLTVLAFFSLVLYFRMINLSFILYGASLFLTLFARELYKDIIWLKGDIINGYESIASLKGVTWSGHFFIGILVTTMLLDITFCAYLGRIELVGIIVILGTIKCVLIYLIKTQPNLIHRAMQLLIMTYITGIVWL